MNFCLKDSGFYLADIQNFLNLIFIKIGQANGAGFPLLICLLHQLVTRDIIARWLMDQEQDDRLLALLEREAPEKKIGR